MEFSARPCHKHEKLSRNFINGNQRHTICLKVDFKHCATGVYQKQFSGLHTEATKIGKLYVDTKKNLRIISEYPQSLFENCERVQQIYVHLFNKINKRSLPAASHFYHKIWTPVRSIDQTSTRRQWNRIQSCLQFIRGERYHNKKTIVHTPEINGLV